MSGAHPTILVVANRKGGTGKTTTAVNLAAGFAASGRRTLLIDLDTQGHCALGLGLTPDAGHLTAHRLLSAPATPLAPAILRTAWEGLDLIPASRDVQHEQVAGDDRCLARVLASPHLADAYELLVIDAPPSLDLLMLNALTVAHRALIPFVPHPLAAEGVRQISRILFRVAMTANPGLRLLGLLPVMLDARIGQHREIREQLGRQFGPDRLLDGIRTDIKLAEAFGAGQPIRVYAPRSRGAEDYASLLESVRARLPGNRGPAVS